MDIKRSTGNNDEHELLLPKPKLIRSKTDLFLILSTQFLYLSTTCVQSTIGPIYTSEAVKKGTTTAVSGLVFGTYPFVLFLLSPIVGKYLPKLGPIYSLVAGSIVQGAGEILFGFLELCQEIQMFVFFSFLLRAFTAIGGAFSKNAILSILWSLYPDHVSFLYGLFGTAAGIGFMMGPSLSGVLYDFGGFKLPFFVIGVSVLLMLGIVMVVLPRSRIYALSKKESESKVSLIQIVKVPGVVIVGMSTFTVGVCISFYESTLAVQLEDLTTGKFNKAQIGAFFLFSVGFYTITAPIWGYIVESKIPGKYIMIMGHALAIVSFTLLGPIPFLKRILIATPVSTAISLSLFGISLGPYIVPVVSTMKFFAIDSGLENDLSLTSIIAGLYTSYFYVGSIIGPIIGGLLLQYSNFAWACFVIVILLFIDGAVLIIFLCYKAFQSRKQECLPH